MRNRTERRKKFMIASLCIAAFLTLGIGYAILTTQLNISGTAQITSNWKILFTSVEEKEMTNAITNTKDISGLTTLTLDVQLQQPGASATYDVVVENQGDLDAMLTAINGVDEANSQSPLPIKVELQNIKVNDGLLAGEKKTFQVRVYWDASVDFSETNMSKEIEITLTYEQRDESEIPSPSPDPVYENIAGQDVEVVSSGDGLYQDQYEDGRYVYRGSNPDNYIQFNDELWRIISKETDGTYKIIRDEVLESRAFDEEYHRTTENNTYCGNTYYGCNVYGAVSGTYTLGSKSGTVTEDSSLAEYLNGTYYNSLTLTAQGQVQTHAFNIGGVLHLNQSGNDSIANNLSQEKAYTWTGNIGLPNITDILRASLNPSCTSATDANDKANICTTNYLVDDTADRTRYWLINGYSSESMSDSDSAWGVFHQGSVFLGSSTANNFDYGVHPTLYLNSNIQITSGNGTEFNPYIIS